MRKALFIIFLLAGKYLSAQTSTGSWYGRADVTMAGIHNNYLTELVIKQKGTRVEGIFGYYFKDKYQSFFIHGRYNPKTREVIILNIPIIYFNSNSTVNSVECNTNFLGTLINSRVKSSLKGNFYRDEKYKYTCPDLKVNFTLDKDDQSHDSVQQDMARANARVWKPQADDYVVDVAKTDKKAVTQDKKGTPVKAVTEAPAPAVKETASPAAGSTGQPIGQPGPQTAKLPATITDTLQNQSQTIKKTATADSPVVVASPVSAIVTSAAIGTVVDTPASAAPLVSREKEEDIKKISDLFSQRTATLNKTLEIESDSVRLSFYDNGEIDGDSISVFVNNNAVLTHQELAAKALTLYLHLDSTREVNEIGMFAENLGKYPPNTALMVITDGKNRYEVFMSSSLTENATIRLKRKKRPKD